ncbi:hypothetical protein AVEN_250490-1 [Araneus ventricosus]|uniref:Uncharacterized protein n=1 Tax=Araneus ventricosus TaxID=182803 RepID=A0A4Y2QW47_ARAVE|nr:hypothetical protein AVEN_250490-1 [Araneus ventricosus]
MGCGGKDNRTLIPCSSQPSENHPSKEANRFNRLIAVALRRTKWAVVGKTINSYRVHHLCSHLKTSPQRSQPLQTGHHRC